jgi:rhodanese-related sulfurtransferase
MQSNAATSNQGQDSSPESQDLQDVIDVAELQEKLDGKGRRPVLLEALGAMYFQKGHLPGAIHFPHERTRELAPQLLPSRDDEIIVYCASPTCRNSHIAAGVLRTLGYRRVRVFAGGKQAWEEAGLPLVV